MPPGMSNEVLSLTSRVSARVVPRATPRVNWHGPNRTKAAHPAPRAPLLASARPEGDPHSLSPFEIG
jgi:hypothetical protein